MPIDKIRDQKSKALILKPEVDVDQKIKALHTAIGKLTEIIDMLAVYYDSPVKIKIHDRVSEIYSELERIK